MTAAKAFPLSKLTVVSEELKLPANENDFNPSLSMFQSNDLTKQTYEVRLNSNNNESGEMVRITWSDVEKTLSSGEYYTPAAIARVINAEQKEVLLLLNRNSGKVSKTKHVSQKNGQHYYVLANKRDRIYEALRPLQIAMIDLF